LFSKRVPSATRLPTPSSATYAPPPSPVVTQFVNEPPVREKPEVEEKRTPRPVPLQPTSTAVISSPALPSTFSTLPAPARTNCTVSRESRPAVARMREPPVVETFVNVERRIVTVAPPVMLRIAPSMVNDRPDMVTSSMVTANDVENARAPAAGASTRPATSALGPAKVMSVAEGWVRVTVPAVAASTRTPRGMERDSLYVPAEIRTTSVSVETASAAVIVV
jgi:hypothetical protein